jgi:hypothetical protein
MPKFLRTNLTQRIARMLRELEGPRSTELVTSAAAHSRAVTPGSGTATSRRDKRVETFVVPAPAGARRR